MKVIINANVFNFDTYRRNRYVLFDDTIRAEGPMSEFVRPADCTEVLDAGGALLMPSMVIGHAHIYGAYLRAFSPSVYHPLTFRELLEQVYWKLDGGLDIESSYYSAKAMALDHIRSGVTTIFDHHASGRAIIGTLEALRQGWVEESGLRGIFCFETSDRFPIDRCIEENVTFARRHHEPDCAGMFGMHASMTLSKKTLDRVAANLGDIPVHVHVAESLEDQMECINCYGKRIVERFADHGLITGNTIFAHCVNIDMREAFVMAEHGVTAAINTTSNFNAGHGFVDYRLLRRFGVNTMIGNDSLGSNIATDIRNFVFSQHLVDKNVFAVTSADALRCVDNGYEHASKLLGVKLGRIREGYAADMMTVDYIPYTPMNEQNAWEHVFDAIFSQFRPRNVWCAGVQKLKNYDVTLDEKAICAKSREVCERLWKSL